MRLGSYALPLSNYSVTRFKFLEHRVAGRSGFTVKFEHFRYATSIVNKSIDKEK